MAVDLNQLIADIKTAVSSILEKDISEMRGFSERQVRALAQQTVLVETGILSGDITEETREFFLDSLEQMTLNFVRTLRGLLEITIEKIWNAVVGVLWSAVAASTGLVLPAPRP